MSVDNKLAEEASMRAMSALISNPELIKAGSLDFDRRKDVIETLTNRALDFGFTFAKKFKERIEK